MALASLGANSMSDWKDIIKAVSPAIAGLLGGPLAATAVGALSESLLGKTGGTMDEIEKAVLGASPEVLAKIKQVEADLTAKLADAGVRMEDIAAKDRDSARTREVSTRDNTVRILAYLYTAAYFGAIWACWKFGIPPEAKDLILVLIGGLTGAQLQILNYYFGTSKSSTDKTAILDRVVNHR